MDLQHHDQRRRNFVTTALTGLALFSFVSIASADVWYGNQTCQTYSDPCAADNKTHTYCWDGGFTSDALRTAATYAMDNLQSQTQFTRQKLGCDSNIDVRWFNFDAAPGVLGKYDCVDKTGTAYPNQCQRAFVKIDGDYINSQFGGLGYAASVRRWVSCHEIGHSGGLSHHPVDSGYQCMNGVPESGNLGGHQQYVSHHVGHLNQN